MRSGERRCAVGGQLVLQQAAQIGEHPAQAGIVELRSDARIDRNVFVFDVEGDTVAFPLLADIAQGILGAALVELVEYDQLGKIEHVDFFQLTRRAEITGHDIHGEIDQIDDLAVALTDTGRLDDHQIKAQPLEGADAVDQHCVGCRMLTTGCHRTHKDALGAQRVHADAVAEQCTTGATTRRVHGDYGNAHFRECRQEAV